MRRLLPSLSSLLLLLALLPAARAQASDCGPYTLAFYELGVLYYHDSQGQPAGIDKDLVDELARRSGCQIKTQLDSRVRIWKRLAEQSLDLSVSGLRTDEREQFAEFMPYLKTRNHALMSKDLAARLPTPEAFLADRKRTVVVVKGYKHGPFFEQWLEGLRVQRRVVEVGSFDAALRVLRAGRADLMLTEPINLQQTKKDEAWLEQTRLLDWAPNEQVYGALIVSRQRVAEADRTRLRQALRAMLSDGSMDAILRRHVGEAVARSMRVDPQELR